MNTGYLLMVFLLLEVLKPFPSLELLLQRPHQDCHVFPVLKRSIFVLLHYLPLLFVALTVLFIVVYRREICIQLALDCTHSLLNLLQSLLLQWRPVQLVIQFPPQHLV